MSESTNTTSVIGIASGKGGVGKTTIAVNLALALCGENRKVALLDADLGLANSQIILGINAPFNVSHVFSGEKSVEEVSVTNNDGLLLIPGASGNESLANITAMQAKSLVEQILQTYPDLDMLIIDSAAGLSSSNMSFLDACDARLVILQDEPASIADAYGLIKLESRKDRLETLFVIPNKVVSQDSGNNLFNKMNRVCMQFLEEPVNYLYSVVQDDLLSQIIRRRESLLNDHPSIRAAANFKGFAKSLIALLGSSKFSAGSAEKVN